ncbi:MAG: Mrp/NBP35 family ATP-binding protein [Erysipelotrichaceae bacterium]|nr:Mrp/NBP35 family ATP-binding protein [Erysipelotrichaceae bacterium]
MSDCNSCPSRGSCGKDENSCGVVNNPNNKIKYVMAVMSGKGGVGKSSLTVMLARLFQRSGMQVGIMDADMTGPSIPRLLALEKEKAYGTNEAIQPVIDKDGIKTMSLNYLMDDENQPVVWRGPIIANAVKQFWTDVVWGELDVLLIDMPPGTGDVPLTVMQSIPVNGVLMISTPQPMVSMIVSKAINMCKEMKIDVLGVIENMSYVSCPDCGKRIELHQHKNTEHFLKENDLMLLAELPMTDVIANLRDEDNYSAAVLKETEQLLSEAVAVLKDKMNHK